MALPLAFALNINAQSVGVLEEVVVTAQKKEENLQETPIAITAITESTIDDLDLANIVDLANLYSCSFIETQDLGKLDPNGFQIMGRFDHSEVRGCNLMIG